MRGGSRNGGPGGVGTNGRVNGKGSTMGGGALNSVDNGGIEVMVVSPPAEGVGMKVGGDDLSFVILFRPWRSVQSPSRNF